MARATRQALETSIAALSGSKGVTEQTAAELFSAARLLNETGQLGAALADATASVEARTKLASTALPGVSAETKAVLTAVVSERWSSPSDMVAGVEELAIRAAATSAKDVDIEGELFAVTMLVAKNPELELALGSKLGDADAKGKLAAKLFGGKVSSATELIVTSLVRAPRGRRVRTLLNHASRVVADARGKVIATVHSAAALSGAQSKQLADALSSRYGTAVTLNEVIDPSIVGGLRVQVADDVIDASLSTRLAELRQQLAG
jgi:F-type H+-transporting ATPase subunit delta